MDDSTQLRRAWRYFLTGLIATVFLLCVGVLAAHACFSDTDCAPRQVCIFAPGTCGAEPGECHPNPRLLGPAFVGCLKRCVAVFEPVCTCDGATWGNACWATCGGDSVAHAGYCTTDEWCQNVRTLCSLEE